MLITAPANSVNQSQQMEAKSVQLVPCLGKCGLKDSLCSIPDWLKNAACVPRLVKEHSGTRAWQTQKRSYYKKWCNAASQSELDAKHGTGETEGKRYRQYMQENRFSKVTTGFRFLPVCCWYH